MQKVLSVAGSRFLQLASFVLLFYSCGANATGTCYQWYVVPGEYFGTPQEAIASSVSCLNTYVYVTPSTKVSWQCGASSTVDCDPSNYTCHAAASGNGIIYSGSMVTGTSPYITTTRTNNTTGEQIFLYSANAPISRVNPGGCKTYVSALLPLPAQCGPTCNGVGDPVNPASGGIYATESDLKSQVNTLEFKRFYNSTDSNSGDLSRSWRHSFSRNVKPKYSSSTYRDYVTSADNSSQYTDEASTCTSGFAEIKSRVSSWANATASYASGVCTLSVGSTAIATLPVLYTSPPTQATGTTVLIGYDATRDDGQVISFGVNGSSIVAPPNITLRMQQISGGYTLTDANDNVETYNTNGGLLSITSGTGVVQIMSYDASGRLSTVTDNFGHQLTLSYDSQSRLISVTRQ